MLRGRWSGQPFRMHATILLAEVLFDGDGDWYVLGAIVLTVAGLVVALYTRRGSQIKEHPRGRDRYR